MYQTPMFRQYLFLIFMRIKVETDWHGLEVMM